MKSNLIGPDSLEADAVVPQCLDNQYVSDEVFSWMIDNNLDYDDDQIKSQREREFKTEFIRSLIYASQIVIQRAFLKNSDFLYKNYLPQDEKNLAAFAKLIRDKAVVPYLWKESSLRDNLKFDVRKEGDRAAEELLKEVGDEVTCVRLATDDTDNDKKTSHMASDFGNRLTWLQHLDDTQRNAMASELFTDRGERLQLKGGWDAFSKALDQLATYSFMKAGELRNTGHLTRTNVYRDNFIIEGGKIELGHFKRPDRENPFIPELKKYVDLVYNTNLPDRLERYTFTPVNLPSRMALQDDTGKNFRPEEIGKVLADKEALTSIRRTFMAYSQKAMTLPLLKDLSVSDVVKIRNLPEWLVFKEAQAYILKDPLHCLDFMERFQTHFDNFQHALSEWFNKEYQQIHTKNKYCNYVSLALSLAGKLFVAGSNLGPVEKAVGSWVSDKTVENIPNKIKGFAAKLIINVYDVGEQKLDRDRSYSIELMQTNAELIKEDVIELLNSISRKHGENIPTVSGQLADQGID